MFFKLEPHKTGTKFLFKVPALIDLIISASIKSDFSKIFPAVYHQSLLIYLLNFHYILNLFPFATRARRLRI